MADKTRIEWADATWNPVTGCSHVSEGCRHCYAESLSLRQGWTRRPWTAPNAPENVRLRPDRLGQPLRWRRPRRIFVNSMSDLFHDQVPDEFIDQVFAVMALSPRHVFQVLTKRPQRMVDYFSGASGRVFTAISDTAATYKMPSSTYLIGCTYRADWPLRNVWLGVSVEDQHTAEGRVPLLLQTPAAVRWISAEPLLGPVELQDYLGIYSHIGPPCCLEKEGYHALGNGKKLSRLDWVVVGGKSGPHARPMHPNWARSLRDQCQAAGVSFFFKQWGEWVEDYDRIDSAGKYRLGFCFVNEDDRTSFPAPIKPKPDREGFNPFDPILRGHPGWTCMKRVGKKAAGHLLDGRAWEEWPA